MDLEESQISAKQKAYETEELLKQEQSMGQSLVDVGLESILVNKNTSPDAKWNKRNGITLFHNHINAVAKLSGTMKVQKPRIVSKYKREYTVSRSTMGKVNYEVVIANIPSCTCSDFPKNNYEVLCKRIIFIVVYVLSGSDIPEELMEM